MKHEDQKCLTFKRGWLHLRDYFLIGLCIILLPLILDRVGVWMYTNGWQYAFSEEIPLLTASPREDNSLSINNSSLYINVQSGFTYSLNRITGVFQWRHEGQKASIYPAAFGENNVMFVSSLDGRVYAIDTRTGKEQWQFVTPGLFMADTGPVISGGFVYFGSRNGILYALDASTGSLKWQFQTSQVDMWSLSPDATINHPDLLFGRFAVDELNVYLNSAADKTIYALNKNTGKTVWKFSLHGYLSQIPTIFAKTIAFFDSDGSYNIIDKISGMPVYKRFASRSQVYEGAARSYLPTGKNSISSIDSSNGSILWTRPTNSTQLLVMKEIGVSSLAIADYNRVTMVDAATGATKWSEEVNAGKINVILFDVDYVYVLGDDAQCAFKIGGGKEWCVKEHQFGNISFLTSDGIYLVSNNPNQTTISYLDKHSGLRKWVYQSNNVNINSMAVYTDDLYFVSKDKKSVVMLDTQSSIPFLQSKRIRMISDASHSISKIYGYVTYFIQQLSAFASVKPNSQKIIIDASPRSIRVNDVYEISVHIDESQYANKYDDGLIEGIFSNAQGKTYNVRAFYYDKNIWKLRFMPSLAGRWTWTIRTASASQHGSFTALPSDMPGFLSISRTDPRIFTLQNGTIFTPIGIQDCILDLKNDGEPLSQWFLGIDIKPGTRVAVSMNTYLSTYAQSGFNIFRWGPGNCSFTLWNTLSSSGNRYALNEGVWADTLFSALRSHNYHVWMTLFSFKLPFDASLNDAQKQTVIKHYLDYVVARYAAYVDVWELANEIKLDGHLITFMSDYIKSIDPYHHPVTVSWERPDLSSVDITSVHWYSRKCDQTCVNEVTLNSGLDKKTHKPLVFSEQGNFYSNWDDQSAARMRVHLWAGFFNKIFFIFWNASRMQYSNVDATSGASDLYIGPTERQYVSALNTFTKNLSTTLIDHPITSSATNAFAMDSGKQILGYVFRRIWDSAPSYCTISLKIPANGKIQWISTTTGLILSEQPVQKGALVLRSPIFSTDISFKIFLLDK